jgi:hypothetical protein
MTRHSDTIRDGLGRPISGAEVYVYNAVGTLDTLTDDAALPLANPVISDEFGDFYFNATDGEKLLEFHYAGELRFKENIWVGIPPKGDPGANVMAIGLFAIAATLSIPLGTDVVRTAGHTITGAGIADYVYDAAVDAAYVAAHPQTSFRSLNARGFKLRDGPLSLELFGGGATKTAAQNDAAMQGLAAFVNAAGGGEIVLQPVTYTIGAQTFGAARPSGQFTNYTGAPDLLLEFVNCTKAIIIRGNGAKFKLAAGLKYGAFDAAGVAVATTPPYFGPTLTSYYVNVIGLTGCSGPFECKNLEIDGSSNAAVLGGQWGDTGWQLGGEGIKLSDHTGTVLIDGVNCHHHTSDGLEINGVAVSAAAYGEGIIIRRSKFNYNGRLGAAIVGGRGIDFEDCQFNWNANTSVTGSAISSAPASGVDIEAEGGKINRDIRFKRCEYVGNQNTQIVADSGPSSDITCDDSRFVSTVAGGTAVWPNKPRMRFNRCLVAGTVVTPYRDLLIPNDTVGWEDCLFSISNEHSPTGTVGAINNLSFDVPTATGLLFVRCRFDFNKPVPATATNFSTDHPRYVDCCFTARDGYPAWNGRFVGKTEFIETGAGSIQYMPGGLVAPFLSKFNAGYAEDSFAYTTGGVRTIYPANFSRHENKPVYFGSAVYDPPSLAAGAKTGIQTIVGGTLAGVALGDRVDTVSFSLDLAGARVFAWVSAANTVSFYFINENGANPLDLGSGTVRVKVIAA